MTDDSVRSDVDEVLACAELAVGKGEHRLAERQFRRALELAPDSEAAALSIVRLLRKTGRLPDAREFFEEMHVRMNQSASVAAEKARVLAEMGRVQESILAFREAQELSNDESFCAFELSRQLKTSGHDGEAIDAAISASRANPGKSNVLAHLEGLLLEAGRFNEAAGLTYVPSCPGSPTARPFEQIDNKLPIPDESLLRKTRDRVGTSKLFSEHSLKIADYKTLMARQLRPLTRSEKRFALFTYSGVNLGDDIQSLAALQFLPRVDALVDRDGLGEVDVRKDFRLIGNGWFLKRRGVGGEFSWPPTERLRVLPVAFHVSTEAAQTILSPPSLAYLGQLGAIGCRDRFSQLILGHHGINAYFSGCLTLTLKAFKYPRRKFVVFSDLPKSVENVLAPASTALCGCPPFVVTHKLEMAEAQQDPGVRYQAAADILSAYAQAMLVVTTRLHCALPCLAIGTPVIFIHHYPSDPRFEPLNKIVVLSPVHAAFDNPEGLLADGLKNDHPNPDKIVQNLTSTCSRFVA